MIHQMTSRPSLALPAPPRRRIFLALAAFAAFLPLAGAPHRAAAQTDTEARAKNFVQQAASELTETVNGSAPTSEKQARLREIVDRTVDVDAVARFCLGRYWRQASPQQQEQYLKLFHAVLVNNITSKIGEYRGVSIAMKRTMMREGHVAVQTLVTRPNNAPSTVEWIVETEGSGPKIIDVIAEGTSLRLTQRSDYASYLARNGNNVQALIDAMRQQVSGAG